MTTVVSRATGHPANTGWPPLLQRVVRTIRTRHLFDPGRHLLVAVSGGPDSMALLSLLNRLRPSWRLTLTVVHYNYGLRGTESDGDQACVEDLCRRWDLPLFVERLDVGSRPRGTSLQATARELRYEAMMKRALVCGADRIALGHTADDQAETVLLWMLRGAGLTGASGMPPCRNHLFVRPLYDTRREDVLAYLREEGVPFRCDSSNEKPVYLRNRIRHEIMPVLEKVVPSAVGALCRLADLCAEDDRYLEKHIVALCEGKITRLPDGRKAVDRSFFKSLPRAVQRRVVRNLCKEWNARGRPPGMKAVESLLRIANAPTVRSSMCMASVGVMIERDRLCFAPSNFSADCSKPAGVYSAGTVPVALTIPGAVVWPETGHRIEAFKIKKKDLRLIGGRDRTRIMVDANRISEGLVVRSWKPGDRFCPFGMGGRSKKLQDFFMDLKVPVRERRCVPIVEAPEGIVWVVGYRQDDRWSVDEKTEWCVVLSVREHLEGS
ncbi:MAG: tRNA lysidine(34) synthetase TilS [Nitrospira sp.]|nr:tRNA lysidine(34) synthetase TilS [Nitrospira sp.]MCP9461850.1 tRNA lysidine(34) synthetase TilS [Nitrospira sp.]